jgi:Ion channel
MLPGMDTAGPAPSRRLHARRLERFHATHSYWVVLVAIIVAFFFAGLAPDAAWATSVLVLVVTVTLVLALRTSGWSVTQSRLVLALVVVGSSGAAANLIWRGNALITALNILAGVLTLVLAVVIALGAVEQGEVNSKSVAGAICVYILLGMLFLYVYGVIAVVGHGPFFAQGTDGTRTIRLYFSYVTLVTLGYGDYTPAGNAGHTFAVLEALIGQLFLVTVVAVVVTRASGSFRRH